MTDIQTTDMTPASAARVASLVPEDSLSYYDCPPYALGANSSFKAHLYESDTAALLFHIKRGKGKTYYRVYRSWGPLPDQLELLKAWIARYRDEADKLIFMYLAEETGQALFPYLDTIAGSVERNVWPEDVIPIDCITEMPGKKYVRLRRDLNKFKRDNPEREVIQVVDDVTHTEAWYVIKEWARQARKVRNVFNLNFKQYTYAFDNFRTDDCMHLLYKVAGEPVALQIMHKITDTCWAHTLGIALGTEQEDGTLFRPRGLWEWSSWEAFCLLQQRGVTHIADGQRVANFKNKDKFRPIEGAVSGVRLAIDGKYEDDECLPFQ